MTLASFSGPSPGCILSQIFFWWIGWTTGRSLRLIPAANSISRYSVPFIIGVSLPEHSRTTSMNLPGNSFIITPPFSPSAIWVTSGGTLLPASSQRSRLFAS